MLIGSGLMQLYVTVFLSSFSGNMVFPAMTDVTMTALCPGEDECALAIYLSAFQQSIIGVSTVVMMPLIGKLSDIYGRKALLTFPLTLSIIPFVILACGRTKYYFYAYFVFKTLTAMLTDGSILCLAVAYVVDVSSEEKRAIGFGMVMGIICATFVGATLVARFLSTDMLFQVAAVVSIMALVYMRIFLKESNFPNESSPLEQPILKEGNNEESSIVKEGNDEESSSKGHEFRKISSPKDLIRLIKTSRTFSLIVLITFFSVVSKSAMEGSSAMYYFKARLHYGKDEYANIMIILGISGIMSQMVFMPALIPIFGEYKLLSFSLFAGFVSMLIDSIAWAQWVPYMVSMFSIFHIMETPCLRSIVSKQFGRNEQGMAQGCISSITSFTNIISPLIFSPLTDLFLSDKAPFNYPGFNFLCMAIGMIIAFIPSLFIRLDATVSSDNNVDHDEP